MENKEDAVTIAPHMHKVVFENDSIRMLDVVVKPGDKADMHWHPKNMVFVIKPGLLRFTKKSGEYNDVELKENQVTSYEGEVWHIVENIGDRELRCIQIEFKK